LLRLDLTNKEKKILNDFKFQEIFINSFIDIVSYIRIKTEAEQLKKVLLNEFGDLYGHQLQIPNLEEMKIFDDHFISTTIHSNEKDGFKDNINYNSGSKIYSHRA
jgi:hypothetical protein